MLELATVVPHSGVVKGRSHWAMLPPPNFGVARILRFYLVFKQRNIVQLILSKIVIVVAARCPI